MSTCIVTGSSSGIGRACTELLTDEGWTVVGFDRAPGGPAAIHLQVDMADPEAVTAAVSAATDQAGPIAAVVSAAGHYESTPLAEVTDAMLDRMLRVHLGGIFALSRAVLPGMLARGSGSIVAIASELAYGGGERDSHYSAAKGAVLGFVRSLAAEVAPHGIRVNAVAPGPTDTPLLAADSPWRAEDYLATLPAGHLTSPQEVALCASWLLSEGTFAVGESLQPNAGAVI